LKPALRTALRSRRRRLAAEAPGAAQAIAGVFEAAGLPLPRIAAIYRAAGSEIDPAPLGAWLSARGVRLCLPVVVERDAPLVFREALAAPAALDALGLPVPPPHAPELRPEVIFVPLLGFDRRGGRIGQGGGYYDRTLEGLRASGPPVLAIGLAYAGQEVERVPLEAFDQPLDGVLTEKAYLPFA
jgi:5-formyltetrahydrofolate cyclo-ligase